MPYKRSKHAPQHRQVAARPGAAQAPRKVLRSMLVMSSFAVTATVGAVSTGIAGTSVSLDTAADEVDHVISRPADGREPAERATPVSRSDRRDVAEPARTAAPSPEDDAVDNRSESDGDEDPRSMARAMMPRFGFSADQFGCLDALWVSESDWQIDADNPTSSAYGIPQALTQLHDLPAGYRTSAEVQVRWGLRYIQESYGSPCSAWSFKQANNWY